MKDTVSIKFESNLNICIPNKKLFIDIFTEEEYGLKYVIYIVNDNINFDKMEIKLNIHPSEVERLVPEIIDSISKKNIELYDGLITSELTGAPVEIKLINKDTFRIIFSDENYLFPNNPKCNKSYINQYYIND